MIYEIFHVLNVCAVQFIGGINSLESHIELYYSKFQFPFPLVLEQVSETNYGKYSAAANELYFSKVGKPWKPSKNHQFSLCAESGTVTILLTQWIYLTVGKIKPESLISRFVFTVLMLMNAFSEDPKFIFIETNPTDFVNNQMEQNIDHLAAPVTSTILLFTKNEIFLIQGSPKRGPPFGTKCIPLNFLYHINVSAFKFLRIINSHKFDFSGRRITLSGGVKSYEKLHNAMTDCSLMKDKWSKFANGCSLKILSTELNFTYPRSNERDRTHPPFYSPTLYFNSDLSARMIKGIQAKKHEKFELIPSSFQIQNYRAYVFTSRKLSNFRGLFEPFDLLTWILLLFSILLTILVLKLLKRFNVTQTMWGLLRMLISQPYAGSLQSFGLPLTFAWFTLSFLLGQIYQGNIYTCLVTIGFPLMPSSVKETLIYNIPVIEISRYNDRGKIVSGIKEGQIKQYKHSCNASGIKVADWISSLEKSIRFSGFLGLRTIHKLLAKDYSLFGNNLTSLETIALLDSIDAADEFADLMEEFLPEYKIYKLNEIYPFNYKAVWVFDRNMMIPKFHRILSGIFQSGLYSYWQLHSKLHLHHYWVTTTYKDWSLYLKSKQIEKSSLPNKLVRFMSKGFGKLHSSIQLESDKAKHSESDEPKPITLSSISLIFVLHSIALAINIIVFSFDRLCY